jgi:PhoH-like ATPase
MAKKLKDLKSKNVSKEQIDEFKKKEHPRIRFKPANKEQEQLLALLADDDVDLILVEGEAGTGKSITCLAHGLNSLMKGVYSKVMVFKSHVEIGKSLGALPGSVGEKMDPVFASVRDNLDFICGRAEFDSLKEKGKLELEPVSYIRGRNLINSFIIVDETQNNTLHELVSIATRVGLNSKMVMMYDPTQSDIGNKSGIVEFVKILRNAKVEGVAHIKLIENHRSRLVNEINRAFREYKDKNNQ